MIPLEILSEPDSILGPVLLGFRSPYPDGLFPAQVWTVAAHSVPAITILRKEGKGRKAKAVPYRRCVLRWEATGGYNYVARCCDRGPNERKDPAGSRWLWEARLLVLKPGVYDDLIRPPLTAMRLDVTRYRFRNKMVLAAGQLALFRHLVIDATRGLDSDAIVIGGEHG
jgi:hypothetical protein